MKSRRFICAIFLYYRKPPWKLEQKTDMATWAKDIGRNEGKLHHGMKEGKVGKRGSTHTDGLKWKAAIFQKKKPKSPDGLTWKAATGGQIWSRDGGEMVAWLRFLPAAARELLAGPGERERSEILRSASQDPRPEP
jgi:hypothetical protein